MSIELFETEDAHCEDLMANEASSLLGRTCAFHMLSNMSSQFWLYYRETTQFYKIVYTNVNGSFLRIEMERLR